MSTDSIVKDLRVQRGCIWNIREILLRFKVGQRGAPWYQNPPVPDNEWIDEFVYRGYLQHGRDFLAYIKGRFAIAYMDRERQCLFLARDWIGELPMHVLATSHGLLVANTVGAIKRSAGAEFTYAYVRSFPHAHAQEIDLSDVDPECVGPTMRPLNPQLFCDFPGLVTEATREVSHSSGEPTSTLLRADLRESVRRRTAGGKGWQAVLLSGGLDSFTVALTMKSLGIPFDAYTLSVGGAGDDVSMAAEFARRLEVTHHVIRVTPEDAAESFEAAVIASEYYPLYNVYCALGMTLLARRLTRMGVRSAFCGEAVNEAVGDYKDWKVIDPRTGEEVVLQRINTARLRRTDERRFLVWGHARDRGKYNKQLGTGLAKHAGSRMVKPFLANGLTLECPYYEPRLLANLVAIPAEDMDEGKSSLVASVFEEDLERFHIHRNLIDACKKVRFQDASDGGRGGITAVLLAAGCDQRRAIEIFNESFDAHLDPLQDSRRLSSTGT